MIEVYDVELSQHYEAGSMMVFRCPKCGDEISVAKYGWWDTKCSCGYRWHMEFYAYTEDDEE